MTDTAKIFNFLQLNEKGVTLILGEAQADLINQKTLPIGERLFLSQNHPCHMLPLERRNLEVGVRVTLKHMLLRGTWVEEAIP